MFCFWSTPRNRGNNIGNQPSVTRPNTFCEGRNFALGVTPIFLLFQPSVGRRLVDDLPRLSRSTQKRNAVQLRRALVPCSAESALLSHCCIKHGGASTLNKALLPNVFGCWSRQHRQIWHSVDILLPNRCLHQGLSLLLSNAILSTSVIS